MSSSYYFISKPITVPLIYFVLVVTRGGSFPGGGGTAHICFNNLLVVMYILLKLYFIINILIPIIGLFLSWGIGEC